MNKLSSFMNWLSDMDWGWWPLLKYRPAKDRDIDSGVLFKVTPLFGSLAGVLIAAGSSLLRDPLAVVGCIVVGWVLFFVLYRITFAVAWNRRAKELRKQRAEPPAAGPTTSTTCAG